MDHLNRAWLLIEQRRYELATKEATEALRVSPDNCGAHVALSEALRQLQRWDESEEAARAAIGLAPDWPYGHLALARVQVLRGNVRGALNTLREVEPLAVSDPDYWCLLSFTRVRAGRLSDALTAARQGLALDPDHVNCRINEAVALIDLGRVGEADQALVASLEHDPESSMNHMLRGITLLGGDRPRDALAHYEEALRLNPANARARRGTVQAARWSNPLYRMVGGLARAVRNYPSRVRLYAYAAVMAGFIAIQSSIRSRETGIVGGLGAGLLVAAMYDVFGWSVQPLFTLPLMLRRRWRKYLTTDEIRAACVAGAWFLYGMVCIGLAFYWKSGTPLLGVLIAATASVPSVAVFECRPGWPRAFMTCFAVVLGGFAVTVQVLAGNSDVWLGLVMLACAFGAPVAGWLGCAWQYDN